jgi:hypothetical protein
MLDVFKFLVIFTVFATVQGVDDVDSMETTFNCYTDSILNISYCYTDYLKRHGLLETSFKTQANTGESHLCEVILSTTVETVYSDLLIGFNKNDELKNAAGCIVENLRQLKWSDLEIKEQVIEISESLTDEEKYTKIKELKHLQEKISSEAILSCLAETEFGELFDEIFDKDDQEDFVGDYCGRTYAVQNNLIDINVYHVNPNPKNIKTQEINCEIINKQHFDEAEKELKQHLLKDIGENDSKADCLIRKYHENHYFNKTLAIALLGELNISADQKKVEKAKFVQSMIKITKDLSEC